jgi:hypothetical protein
VVCVSACFVAAFIVGKDSPQMLRRYEAVSADTLRSPFEAVRCAFGFLAGFFFYVLALTTGMRQGEILGLRWRHVDLDGASLADSRLAPARWRQADRGGDEDRALPRQVSLTSPEWPRSAGTLFVR